MKSNDRLAAIIAKGKIRYILVNGVLGWGLLTATLIVIWTLITQNAVSTKEILLPFIIFPIGGIFWGAFMWFYFKKRFDKLESQAIKQK